MAAIWSRRAGVSVRRKGGATPLLSGRLCCYCCWLDKLTACSRVQPKEGLPGQKDEVDFSFLGVGGRDIDKERVLAGLGID
ncbi:hypothetical protein NC653_034485 [Populus alba x Populus x berolinensis]|uniref:Uncharacterized protein n=1 Tax=Populus alba x Populus x berolinensis TaxID=444605 RepID=A0AAD6LMS2_9ROSI|nr:hypothetical protein NC653_034485 [Populus alba x Populus x berolinensis]